MLNGQAGQYNDFQWNYIILNDGTMMFMGFEWTNIDITEISIDLQWTESMPVQWLSLKVNAFEWRFPSVFDDGQCKKCNRFQRFWMIVQRFSSMLNGKHDSVTISVAFDNFLLISLDFHSFLMDVYRFESQSLFFGTGFTKLIKYDVNWIWHWVRINKMWR